MNKFVIMCVFGVCCFVRPVWADETAENKWDTFEVMPLRIISVKGDAAKFRALNWIDDGATGGIKAMRFVDTLGDGGTMTFEGSAIPGDNQYDTMLKFVRQSGSYMTLNYSNYRKFYGVYGGHFPNFTGAAAVQKLDVDPAMDIGNFFFEIGSNSNVLETVPGASLSYERRTKEGIKSVTQWGRGASQGGLTRATSPGWQEESVVMDTITLKGNTDVAGFNLSGEQRGEILTGRTFRDTIDNTTESLSQEFEPQASNIVSMVKADKWMMGDKTYMSFAYRYQHTHSNMNQQVRIYNTTTGVVDTSDSHTRSIDAKASQQKHSWVQHFTTQLMPHLNVTAKLKQDLISASGSGTAENLSSASNNRNTNAERKETNLGESISLRYTGIPKTSLYTDWDFEQTHNWYWRTRIGSSQFEILDTGPKTTGVVGARYVPNAKVNITSQYRFRKDRDNFDVFYNDDNGITISRFNKAAHEFSTRLAWKPTKWLNHSVRVMLGNTVRRLRNLGNFSNSPDWQKSQTDSQTYAYNAVLQPWDAWLFDFGYTLNNYKVSTPASQYATASGGIPTYYANFHHWLMTASYAPTKDLSLFASGQYTLADNYDDKSFAGIPYGVDNEHYDVTLGMQWTPREDLSIKPHYGYYSYRANESIDYGSYSAHAGWLDVSFNW